MAMGGLDPELQSSQGCGGRYGFVALAVGPALLVMYLFEDPTAFLVAMGLSIVALIAWSHFEATRTR